MQFPNHTSDLVPFTFKMISGAPSLDNRSKPVGPASESVSIWSRWRIPQELTDEIIDHLHNDRGTLSSCSLVCRSWLHSSSLHLLHYVKVPKCGHSRTAISRCFCGARLRLVDTYHVFDEFLQCVKDSSRMCSFVQDLCLSGKTDESTTWPLSLSEHTLDGILSHLTALRHLTLYNCKLRLADNLTQTNGRLDSLTIIHHADGGRRFDSVEFISLLSRFQHISKLTFDGCEIHEAPHQNTTPASLVRDLGVTALEFTRCSLSSQNQLIMYLPYFVDFRKLSRVQLSDLGPASGLSSDALLQQVSHAPSLGLAISAILPISAADTARITHAISTFLSLLQNLSFTALQKVDVVVNLRCRCRWDGHSFDCLYRDRDTIRTSLAVLDWGAIDTAIGSLASVVHLTFALAKSPILRGQDAYDAMLGAVVGNAMFPSRLQSRVHLVAREVIA